MTGSDKLIHKKVLKISKSRGLADEPEENPYYKSQYNDDRNLDNFENDQIFRHQIRTINENSDIDPSDSEVCLHTAKFFIIHDFSKKKKTFTQIHSSRMTVIH